MYDAPPASTGMAHCGVPARRLALPTLIVVLGAALLLPLGLILAGLAGPVRLLFPLYALAIASWLEGSRRPLLPAFAIALFAFSPFLRRMADARAGFEMFSPVLLGPYFALLPTIPSFLRVAFGHRGRIGTPFLVLGLCLAYACLLSAPSGRLLETANDLVRWFFPIALCTFVLDEPAEVQAIKRSLITAIICILPILAIYGVLQYANPQIWDVLWMLNTRNAAIAGMPAPYQVRVFSMMNSAMSFAVFATSALMLVVGEGLLGLVMAAITLPAIALTMDRQAWLQCVIGATVLFFQAPPNRRFSLMIGLLLVTVGAMSVIGGGILPPMVQNVLDQRIATFSDLSADHSANERLQTYTSFIDRLADRPFGEGFGVSQSTAGDADHQNLPALDSAVLEIGLIFGVAIGSLFLMTLFQLTRSAMKARRRRPVRLVGATPLLVSILLTSPLGNDLSGEAGVLTWLALGILLAEPATHTWRGYWAALRAARPKTFGWEPAGEGSKTLAAD